MRLRTGIGAAVVLVLAALVCSILITAFRGAEEGHARTGSTAHPASSGHGRTGDATGAAGAGAEEDAAAGSAPTAEPGPASAPGSSAGDAAATPATEGAPGSATPPIYVHVVGAVVAPGLFPLAPGSRVVDALAAAHGFADGADAAGVNLARVLSDGEQLVVPRQGEAPTGDAAGAPGGAGTAGGGTGPSPGAKVDLNQATAEQLETLPRVGPAMAQRIIAWRSAHGRFTRVADLGRVPGIGDRTLASLTPLVRV